MTKSEDRQVLEQHRTLIPEGPGELAHRLVAEMETITLDRIGKLGLANARRNRDLLSHGKTLAALRDENIGEGDSCIVVAAGPSLARRDPIKAIKQAGYRGAIIATESAMSACLRQGVIPHLTVTLDPHATRIVRWFGDPTLDREATERDDYFRRQDMDRAFADELRLNSELIELINRHGKDVRIALSTSASEAVVNRVIQAGMPIYWWNPMYDDPDEPGSVTRALYRENRLPCMNAGGNVGTAAWMLAHSVLGKAHVAIVGMDLSYYDDTPYYNTQYYHELVALVGEERLDSVFVRIHNPYTDRGFYTDPAYLWYRRCFLELAPEADCRTYNCTGGGILFGDAIEFIELEHFLTRFAPSSSS
jgi:hypothetical protein